MKLIEHYTRLYETYITSDLQDQDGRVHLTRLTKMEDIRNCLCCTTRHAKWLIKQFQQQQWIQWEAARGRGKASKLTFLVHPDEAKAEEARQWVREGKYDMALTVISEADHRVKEQFHAWLGHQLGYRMEMEGNKELDVLRYPFYPCIVSLDPAYILSRHDSHYVEHVFDTLVQYDRSTHRIVPHLAHHWERLHGGMEWRFYLRKGVRFHHGRELTAEDVVQTFLRFPELNRLTRSFWEQLKISDMKALGSHTVAFTLAVPSAILPQYFCSPATSIIPYDIWERDPEAFHRMPVGTGPFRIAKHDRTMLVLEAFESYFLGRAELDRVEILTVPDLSREENELLRYQYNFAGSPEQTDDGDRKGTCGDSEDWDKLENIEDGASYFTFNMNKQGPHQNLLLRQALCLALPIERIDKEMDSERYMPAYSLFYDVSQERSAFRPSRPTIHQLREWVRLSGYNGELVHICSTELRPKADHGPVALWLQRQWEQLGVRCRVSVVPIHELMRPERLAEVDVVVAGVVFAQSPLVSFIRTYQSDTSFILKQLAPSYRHLVDQTFSRMISGSERAWEEMLELEEQLLQEHFIHYLYHRSHYVYVKTGSHLQGVRLTSNGRVDYRSLWFKRA